MDVAKLLIYVLDGRGYPLTTVKSPTTDVADLGPLLAQWQKTRPEMTMDILVREVIRLGVLQVRLQLRQPVKGAAMGSPEAKSGKKAGTAVAAQLREQQQQP